MPINLAVAVGAVLPTRRFEWTVSDVLLYQLGVGGGRPASGHIDLRYVMEGDAMEVLPSFAVVAPALRETATPVLDLPGCDIDLAAVLHYDQRVALEAPIRPAGSAMLQQRLIDVFEARNGSVVVREGRAFGDDGRLLWTVSDSLYIRGERAGDGRRRPVEHVPAPDRRPDAVRTFAVAPDQALLYRLSGDRNPLHVDPEFAACAGFEAPILHGLCTYGIALREMIDALFGGDSSAVRAFAASFAGVVYPGDTITINMWRLEQDVVIEAFVVDGAGAARPVLRRAVAQLAAARHHHA